MYDRREGKSCVFVFVFVCKCVGMELDFEIVDVNKNKNKNKKRKKNAMPAFEGSEGESARVGVGDDK